MPKLKKIQINTHNEMGYHVMDVELFVNADGLFYALLAKEYAPSIEDTFERKNWEKMIKPDKIKVFSTNLDSLIDSIKEVLKKHTQPKIKKENVILYNIESHIAFTEDAEGNIYPNGRYHKNEEWHWNNEDKYGKHHASEPCQNGYSLTIGAEAKTKIIYTYGNKEVIKYEAYYGENGWHLNTDNPAEKLNSWCSFTLPKNAKEIPYSDENALFFYNLLYGMATISKSIQDKTFNQEDLLALIKNGSNMLPAPVNHLKDDNE